MNGADMELRFNGEVVASESVLDPTEIAADVSPSAGTHVVAVAFTNDCYEPDLGFDRNYTSTGLKWKVVWTWEPPVASL